VVALFFTQSLIAVMKHLSARLDRARSVSGPALLSFHEQDPSGDPRIAALDSILATRLHSIAEYEDLGESRAQPSLSARSVSVEAASGAPGGGERPRTSFFSRRAGG
jgi:hypothetical protein